jgi:hypothetical protein
MRRICLFFILVLVYTSCRKEKELITGDITGRALVYKEDLTSLEDKSGVQVSLFSDTTLLNTTLTDIHGQYRFENIVYGRYKIDLKKEYYIKAEDNYTFYHIGGYSPTLKDAYIYEIPDYTLTIDSIMVQSDSSRLKLYLKINGDTLIPFFYYYIIGYCSTSPDVSMDNYSFSISGMVWGYLLGSSGDILNNVQSLNTSETYYLMFYLIAQGHDIYGPINKQALGKPSNVVSFKWH